MSQPRSRTIEWQDPSLSVAAADGRSGLEFLQAIIAGQIPQAPISATLSFVLVAAGDGTARFEGRPGEEHYNPMGAVHGGYACTLLDSALGCAVLTTLDAGSAYTTAQLNVNLTRPITRDTGLVIAESRILQRGRRLATAEATLRDAAGNLLAHATTTCLVFPRK